MSRFDDFLNHLAALGYRYDTGFLIPVEEGTKPRGSSIGFRFEAGNQQIDLYIRNEFWDTSKSHPILGESQKIEGASGQYQLTPILAK